MKSKRPRDTNQLAKLMVDILMGEVEDRGRTPEERGVDPALAMGKECGPARAASMAPERRAEIAKKAAAKRWGKDRLPYFVGGRDGQMCQVQARSLKKRVTA